MHLYVVIFHDFLNQLRSELLGFLKIFTRDFIFSHRLAHVALKVIRFHPKQINDSFVVFFETDRDLHPYGMF